MVMKKFLRLLLLLLAGLYVVCSVAFAEDGDRKPNCAFTWTFYSNYIWQGLELNKANPFFPPSNGYKKGLSLTLGRNFDSVYSDSIPWGNKETNGILAYQTIFLTTNKRALN